MKNRYTPRRLSWAERRHAFAQRLPSIPKGRATDDVGKAGYLEDPALQNTPRPRHPNSKTAHKKRRCILLFDRALLAWGFDARMQELYGGACLESDTL